MRRRQMLALLGVLGTEGCLRLAEGDGTPTGAPSPTRSPTASPTETPTDPLTPFDTDSPSPTATPSLVEQVDGLTVSGPTPDLADTHRRALETVSYEARWYDENLTTGEVTLDRTWTVADGRAIGQWTNEGPVSVHLAEEGYWREDLGSQVTYGHHRHGYRPGLLARTGMVRTLLRGGSWAPPELIESPPPGLFRIVGVGIDDEAVLTDEFGGSEIASFSGQGRVDGRGIIQWLLVDLETVVNGSREKWQIDLQWDPTGVSVSAPSWLSTARAQAPEVAASLTQDRAYVRWEYTGGNDMLGPFSITLFDEENHRNEATLFFEGDFQAGEPVYLYHEGDGTLQFSSGSRPSSASPVTLDASGYSLWARRRPKGLEYFFIGDV